MNKILRTKALVPGCKHTWLLKEGGVAGERLDSVGGPEWMAECLAACALLDIHQEWHRGSQFYQYYAWPVPMNGGLSIMADRAIVWICRLRRAEYAGAAYLQLINASTRMLEPTRVMTLAHVDLANQIRVKMVGSGMISDGAEDYALHFKEIGTELWLEWMTGTADALAAFIGLAKAAG